MAKTKGATTKKKIERLKRTVHRYDQDTINRCFKLYLLYNGQRHGEIATEMRKTYPWFNEGRIAQWAAKYAWEAALKTKIEADKRQALTTADELVGEIETVRKKLYELIKGDGTRDKELIGQHIHYCRLSVEALVKVKEAQDTLGGFLAFAERFLNWLGDYSPHAKEAVLQVWEQLSARAAEEYGGQDEAPAGDE